MMQPASAPPPNLTQSDPNWPPVLLQLSYPSQGCLGVGKKINLGLYSTDRKETRFDAAESQFAMEM